MKARLSKLVERTWWWTARSLRHRGPCRTQALKPVGRVLVVAPHPDDETAACSGTLCQHLALGDEIHVLFVTNGAASRMVKGTTEERCRIRHQEGMDALNAMGIEQSTWLDLDELTWSLEAGVEKFSTAIYAFQPQVIYSPSLVDGHPDHVRSAQALALALRALPLAKNFAELPEVRCYPIHTPLTPLLVNLAVDTQPVSTLVDQAYAAYPSQHHALKRIRRLRRYSAAAHGGKGETETFWCMSSRDFVSLHAAPSEANQFTGPRPSSFRDPWPYVRGLRRRFELSNLIDS